MTPPTVIALGEMLLRLAAPAAEPLLQSCTSNTCFGGAEANVAVALARLGTSAGLVSVLPDNALGKVALAELRSHGVDVAGIRIASGRLGLYFLVPGSGPRAAEVTYDRADSAFARIAADAIDWRDALAGVQWLHVSGVTLAVSEGGAVWRWPAPGRPARPGARSRSTATFASGCGRCGAKIQRRRSPR